MLQVFAGLVGMYEGKSEEAQSWFGRARTRIPGSTRTFV